LRLEDGVCADILLGRGIEAAEHQADVVDDGVVFVVAGKSVLLGDGIELRVDLRIWLGIVRNLVGDRVDVLLRREHALDLLLGQRHLLDGGSLLRLRRRSGLLLGRRRHLLLLGLRQGTIGGGGNGRSGETCEHQRCPTRRNKNAHHGVLCCLRVTNS
jgi:hypothetical protein